YDGVPIQQPGAQVAANPVTENQHTAGQVHEIVVTALRFDSPFIWNHLPSLQVDDATREEAERLMETAPLALRNLSQSPGGMEFASSGKQRLEIFHPDALVREYESRWP